MESHRWVVAQTVQPAVKNVVRGTKIPATPRTDFDWLKARTSSRKL